MHFGKEVSLKIYERREIAAGQSRYQIVQQPKFPTRSKLMNDRRGDLMLLINGINIDKAENIINEIADQGWILQQIATPDDSIDAMAGVLQGEEAVMFKQAVM